MAKKRPVSKRRVLKSAPRAPFPWWPFLLLLLTLGLFWLLPRRMGSPPVRVEFAGTER